MNKVAAEFWTRCLTHCFTAPFLTYAYMLPSWEPNTKLSAYHPDGVWNMMCWVETIRNKEMDLVQNEWKYRHVDYPSAYCALRNKLSVYYNKKRGNHICIKLKGG